MTAAVILLAVVAFVALWLVARRLSGPPIGRPRSQSWGPAGGVFSERSDGGSSGDGGGGGG